MPPSPTFDAGRFAVLELIARGRALPDVLDRIVRLIEAQRVGLLASILLVDWEGQCLRDGAAPVSKDVHAQHAEIVEELRARAPKRASRAMKAHLEHTLSQL